MFFLNKEYLFILFSITSSSNGEFFSYLSWLNANVICVSVVYQDIDNMGCNL